jgi:hypothetical protein
VVVRFDATVQYVGGTAQDPFRIFFDIEGTQPAAKLASRAFVDDPVVQRIRVAQNRPGVTRMVLDLTRPAPYTATFLANPPRLVIEIMRSGSGVEPRNVKAPAPSVLAAASPPPPAPLVPEQMSPVPPQVTYRNGLLTIEATNSTLSDILHSVAVRTGATVEAPADLIGQRVAVRIGPAPPREVMADLLSGLDYIVVGASNDPGAIRNIILHSSSSLGPSAGPISPPAPQTQVPTPPSEQSAAPAEPEPAPQPAAQESKPSSGEGGQPMPLAKTPEELLEELRKLQEQQSKEPGR